MPREGVRCGLQALKDYGMVPLTGATLSALLAAISPPMLSPKQRVPLTVSCSGCPCDDIGIGRPKGRFGPVIR